MTLLNTTAIANFSLLTSGQTFTRTASSIAGTAIAWDPNFTDNGDGSYTATYLVNQLGIWQWGGESTDGTVVSIEWDVTSVNTNYTTLNDLKARLNRGDITVTNDDARLEAIIAAASREIDGMTNRVFYQLPNETRYFTADCGDWLAIDDLVSVTSIATDDGSRTYGTTWQVTDYDLEPYNAASKQFPYTNLHIAPNGHNAFPRTRRGVRITGTWGWPAIPSAVTEACLLIAQRLATRSKAPFGVAGAQDGTAVYLPRTDPDARALLEPYRRFAVGVI